MRFRFQRSTAKPYPKPDNNSFHDISDLVLEFKDDLVFEGKNLAAGTQNRHDSILRLWKKYFGAYSVKSHHLLHLRFIIERGVPEELIFQRRQPFPTPIMPTKFFDYYAQLFSG